MTPLLVNHEKWAPSVKYYYNQYHSSIKFVGFGWNESKKIPPQWDGKYRSRNSWLPLCSASTTSITFYTSDYSLLEFLLSDPYYAMHLDYLSTPIDATHESMLTDSNSSVIFRNNLFYNTYSYRITNTRRYGEIPEIGVVESAMQYVTDNFKEYKCNYPNGKFYDRRQLQYHAHVHNTVPSQYRRPKFPTIYTSDGGGAMMLKMGYGQELKLHIDRVYVTNQANDR
jgi:hypothetical protein